MKLLNIYKEQGRNIQHNKAYVNGAMTMYSNGPAPWYEYRSQITKIVVNNGVTSIDEGAFYGFASLKEITIPFVGASRTATGPDATCGYFFGYTTVDVYADYASTSVYHGIFYGNNTTMVGNPRCYYEGNNTYLSKYYSNGSSYSTLGWSSEYG